jgi:phenylacetate-CoA ligase
MMRPLPLSALREFAWPAVPGAAASSMLAMQWQLEESQWWPREVLLEHQFRQLRALVSHAVAHVPYYRDALREANLGSAADLDPRSFRRWPILRKRDVRPNEAALTASVLPPSHGRRTYTHTTGSTGEPTRVAHTEVTQFFTDALSIHDHLLHDRNLTQKYAVIKSSVKRASQPGWGLINALFATGPGVQQSSSIDVDAQLDWLMEERPAYLQSYSSNLLALVRHSALTGKVPSGIRQLIGYGDMPPADLPSLAKDVWNAQFVATYSTMELGPIASQCPGHSHYLVHAPVVYVEVIGDDGEPCAPGETGRVVATALHNFAMPLIRYEIGDYAEVGDPCPTGRGLPTLRRIVGRYRNMLRHPDGKRTWPSFPGELWIRVAPVRKVRLVQTALSNLDVQYVMQRDLNEEEMAILRSELVKKLGSPFAISFRREFALERTPGDKWEDFVSQVPD